MDNTEVIWIPDKPPRALLPPYVEPEFTLNELCDLSDEEYAREYYMRSGQYLGIYATREEADKADKYRYTRRFCPGGKLPWEKTKEEETGE